ncbi:hypothetical protein SAMN05421835_101736 [Amycolatopsis sacchari]|uniref:DUF2231 domain-containing protein n=1 Tax=Amycolatopsis sacchari TaxID=115433 RepID=A0A1I3KXU3_9PSEU|nr:DUF2231 domain-containing protein [Amycolatopsis sacchari]SFI77246.1 hypothetical protein SAMN05421835_101736 [Amycolatopsis sacchari]
MPVFISGLPLHVMVVHAVVVLVPLSVLAALVVALWPAARRRYGWLAVGVTAVATVCIPIATSSGEDLRDRLVPTELIREHAHLGDQLLVFVAALLVVLAALVWFARRPREAPGAARPPLRAVVPVLVVLTVGLAVVSAVQVVRIGDSGARAAWSGVQYTAPQHEGDDG